jgi:hypothetical protein
MKKLLVIFAAFFFLFVGNLKAQEEPPPSEPAPAPQLIYGSIHGGGHIFEAAVEASAKKRKDFRMISFGGYVENNGGELGGFWEVVFHRVGNRSFDKAKFHSTSMIETVFEQGEGCRGIQFKAEGVLSYIDQATGRFKKEEGWILTFVATDSGPPRRGKSADTVWIGLTPPGGVGGYDSSLDFTSDTNCLTWEGTYLDKGNLTVLIMTEEAE